MMENQPHAKEIGVSILSSYLKQMWLQSDPIRLERFMKSNVSQLLKSDLLVVLAEFQRQDLIFLSMKVIDRISERLEGWKAKTLSFAGRKVLAQSVLNTFPYYTMQSTWFPSGICDEN